MNLIFLGPPGVGKGTQAKYICEKYNILHLSTGDILRFEIDEETETGTIAKKYIDNGGQLMFPMPYPHVVTKKAEIKL